MKTGTVLLSFAAIFTALALLGVALSFATDHWKELIVNRDAIKAKATTGSQLERDLLTNDLYFTSYRGLFRTCYPGNETAWLDDRPNKVDGSCLSEQGYEIPNRNPNTVGWGAEYNIRIHLLRAHFAFFCLALLFLLVGCILGAIGCWSLGPRVTRTAGLIVFFGAFFVAAGMAVFHGYEYLEKNDIRQSPFPAKWYMDERYNVLKSNSSYQYGYSYILGWVGMGVAALGAIMYLAAAWSVTAENKETRRSARKYAKKASKDSGRNKAYDYMDKNGHLDYPPDMYQAAGRGGYPQAAYPADPYASYGGDYRY